MFINYISDKYAGVPFAPIVIPPGASFADMARFRLPVPRQMRSGGQATTRAKDGLAERLHTDYTVRPRTTRFSR